MEEEDNKNYSSVALVSIVTLLISAVLVYVIVYALN
tara:strand:+ start:286 stop:393 length:108 start_codon:yes stop_codon:yes gene_type:complete